MSESDDCPDSPHEAVTSADEQEVSVSLCMHTCVHAINFIVRFICVPCLSVHLFVDSLDANKASQAVVLNEHM